MEPTRRNRRRAAPGGAAFTAQDAREARLKATLKANMARRKAQARAQASGRRDDDAGGGAAREPTDGRE